MLLLGNSEVGPDDLDTGKAITEEISQERVQKSIFDSLLHQLLDFLEASHLVGRFSALYLLQFLDNRTTEFLRSPSFPC